MSLAEPDDRALRATFEQVARSYRHARPPLPDGLLDAFVTRTGVPPGGRVLEIGCGTGQATVELASRGYAVTAVELGTELATIAREELAAYPNVDVQVGAFETWSPPAEPFEVVTAFHAWHWLDPSVALAKAAQRLRPGGALAIVGGVHVAGGDTEFFDRVQSCYEAHMPGTRPGQRLVAPDDVPSNDWGTAASDDFDAPIFMRWVQVTEYSTATYFDLLRSFSGHIALDAAARDALFACIAGLLERDYGGRVRRATLTELCVARRR